MSDSKYVLVEHSSVINTIIQQTFQTTQRIKFTTFDVSSKYVIFGANSGGIYIFQREPCQFLKLIPSTHGATNIMQISPNEENLALATITGLVIVLEGFANSQFEQQVFTEHESQTVTALRWNGNDLYCGDSIGRVSVITVKAFLTKAIFQPPVACLMHLDNQIVQLDTFSRFLLVSTHTRSLLCDIETERFRQIGKKARDGTYGSCFLNSSVSQTSNINKSWGLFTTVESDEQFVIFESDVKIYCARPGLRLWQADFQGNVVLTHQFKSSLPQTPNKIIQWGNWDELKIKFESAEWENFNFKKIYPILDKFILTFTTERFYIFEPASSLLLFWGNLKNIQEIKTVDSTIYVWHNNMEVAVFSLLTVEEIVLRSLIKNRYRLCGQLCVEFLEEVERLIPSSKKIHILSALENKLQDADILEKLAAIFAKLKELAKNPNLEKVTNGIVTVNALPVLPESVENFQSVEKDKKISILLEQYKVNKNKIHENIETNEFIKLVESLNTQDFYQLLMKFQRENTESDHWCKEIFLKKSKLENPNSGILNYITEAFFEFNDNLIGKNICECDFPIPKAHQTPPKYCDTGEKLIKHDFDNFLRKIPYMYKFALKNLDAEDVQLKISLLIQFSDLELMKIHSSEITYDLWDESVKLLSKLKSGQCLNCKLKIDPSASFQWSDFGILMINSIKPSNTIKLLRRYSHLIPDGELNEFFYQYCIFSSITKVAKDFEIENQEEKEQLEATVGGFLRKKYLRGDDYQPSVKKLENCDHCHLPLKTPILDKIERLSCGHNYHRFCFTHIKSMCSSCEPVLLMQNKFEN